MARATLAEVDDLRKQVESLESKAERLHSALDLETNRADRATKALRAFYTFAELPGVEDGTDVDNVELDNEIVAILGYSS